MTSFYKRKVFNLSLLISSKNEFHQSCCYCILLFLLFPVLQSLLGLCRVQVSCDHLFVDVGLSPSPFKSVRQSINQSINQKIGILNIGMLSAI